MSSPFCQAAGSRPAKHDIDRDLLQKTQAYLECQSKRLPADWPLRKAWEQFYDAYAPLIRRFAAGCGVRNVDLDDCVQQVLIEVVRRLGNFRHDPERARFRSWLYALVHRRAADLLRYRLRHPTEPLSEVAAAELRARDGDPAAAYERQRQRATVRRVLADLNRRISILDYCVFHMRWMEGRSVPEVAIALGLTPAQVSRRSYRVKQKFRRLFDLYTGQAGHLNA
jgi:RNA polymerase sigma factor (sigma-70 family)